MKSFTIFLKLAALGFIAASLLHLIFGLGADAMLGAKLSSEALTDPTLNSQNRFYGTAFALYGVLLYLCATDMRRYEPVLMSVLAVYFLAGCARLVSIATHGMPPPLVLVLLALELLPPPLIIYWYLKAKP